MRLLGLCILVNCMLLVSTSCSEQIKLHYLSDPFHVQGQASASLAAEQVSISLAVETLSLTSAGLALSENSKITGAAIVAWKQLGLSESEIQTQSIQVFPSYKSQFKKETGGYEQVFEGYKVRNAVRVVTKKMSLAGKIIDEAINNGITQVDSVAYSPLSKSVSELKENLLAVAVKDAKKKAQIILAELDQTIVSVKSVQIVNDGVPMYRGGVMPAAAPFPGGSAPTQVFAGEFDQHVLVDVAFIIEDVERRSHVNE